MANQVMKRPETKKRIFKGEVVSNKGTKTITVKIDSLKKHPIFHKNVLKSTKLRAHDEKQEANVGDIVKIQECRPISATKKFRLLSIDKKAIKREVKETVSAEGAKE